MIFLTFHGHFSKNSCIFIMAFPPLNRYSNGLYGALLKQQKGSCIEDNGPPKFRMATL
jgi:hypothetical protein